MTADIRKMGDSKGPTQLQRGCEIRLFAQHVVVYQRPLQTIS